MSADVQAPASPAAPSASAVDFTDPADPNGPGPVTPPVLDPQTLVLGEVLADRILALAATAPRSHQVAIGFSEVDDACGRRLAHRLAGTPTVHRPDPLPSLFGVGIHHVLAEGFARLDAGVGRFLVEHRVSYRGVVGTTDLYDRRLRTVVDWKSTTKAKIARQRRMGVPTKYVTQLQGYAAGLAQAGEDPTSVALVYLPTDGTVADIWIWRAAVDRAPIDAAIDRLDSLREHVAAGKAVADIRTSPSPLCGWCPFYKPNTTDLGSACPGPTR